MKIKKYFSQLNFSELSGAVGLAAVLFWLSLFLSFQKNNNVECPTDVFAFGGWPAKALQYPCPPMGNDHVPTEQLGPLAFNTVFWFFVSIVILGFIPEKIKTERLFKFLFFTGLILSIIGKAYLVLKFD